LLTAVQRLTTIEQVDALMGESSTHPVLVFKHSLTCGTSAQALDELADHLEHADGPHAHYALVTVQTHRDVSTAISTRVGIRHETPQALLIMGGRVVWSASHFRVTAEAIAKAIQSHQTADLQRP
jgi:bacillithiol system protein YtxJ